MAWETKCNPSLGIIETTLSGNVTGDDLEHAAKKRILLQKETNTNSILVDLSGMDNVIAGTLDIFSLPSELYDSEKASRNTDIALITSNTKQTHGWIRFYETACLNRGWSVKTFDQRATAINWLLESMRKPEQLPYVI